MIRVGKVNSPSKDRSTGAGGRRAGPAGIEAVFARDGGFSTGVLFKPFPPPDAPFTALAPSMDPVENHPPLIGMLIWLVSSAKKMTKTGYQHGLASIFNLVVF